MDINFAFFGNPYLVTFTFWLAKHKTSLYRPICPYHTVNNDCHFFHSPLCPRPLWIRLKPRVHWRLQLTLYSCRFWWL